MVLNPSALVKNWVSISKQPMDLKVSCGFNSIMLKDEKGEPPVYSIASGLDYPQAARSTPTGRSWDV